MCGARNLGEALRRIAEGAAMMRTKGEAGSGNIVEAVRHIRTIVKEMRQLTVLGKEELVHEAKNLQAPLETGGMGGGARQAAGAEFQRGRDRDAGGRGAGDAVGRGGGVRGHRGFSRSSDPAARAEAIVKAAKNFNNPEKLLEASRSLGDAMPGLEISKIAEGELLQTRGW